MKPPRAAACSVADPDGTVLTVVPGLYFANGVTPTADGSALVFAETQGRRLSKYWLSGPQAGTVTPLAVNLPGMPDNLSTGRRRPHLVCDGHAREPVGGPAGAGTAPSPQDCCGGCQTGCSRSRSP